MKFKDNIERELYLSYRFFMHTYSRNECSFGLIPDSYPGKWNNTSSVAGTGYLFSALVIGVESNYLDKEKVNFYFSTHFSF